jgi:hypothetical protein
MDFAILVLSCDKYSHVWPAFFKAFRKYFPGNTWPVYLGSNTLTFQDSRVKTLLTGDDPDWSTSYARILKQIPEQRIFVILEDLLFASPVDAEAMKESVEFMRKTSARHLKYYKPLPADRDVPGEPFGEYASGRPYRISVVGFWDKEYLLSLLIPGESPWNFEIMGSYRASYAPGFFMMKKTLCEFANLIEKGRWYPAAVDWAKKEGLDIGFEKRQSLSGVFSLKSLLQIVIYRIVGAVPWRARVRLMNFLRRVLISY